MLFGAVSHLLCDASADRPLLLVLDDLHWADKATLLLVRHLVGSGTAMRMLVVGVSWGGFDDPGGILKDLSREPGALRMELGGLTPADVTTLFETAAERPLSAAERSFADELTTRDQRQPVLPRADPAPPAPRPARSSPAPTAGQLHAGAQRDRAARDGAPRRRPPDREARRRGHPPAADRGRDRARVRRRRARARRPAQRGGCARRTVGRRVRPARRRARRRALHVLPCAAEPVARQRAVARTARAAPSADRRGAGGARRRSAARPARSRLGSPPASSTSVRSPRRAKPADGRWRASPLTRPPAGSRRRSSG